MSCVRESVSLAIGVDVNGARHLDVVLRPARLADTYAAAALVDVPADMNASPARVAYQMAIDDMVVLHQVESVGDLDLAPAPSVLVECIDPEDMALLRAGAERLKKKLQQLKLDTPISGASSASSSGTGSA